jgi:hypothetical protein
MKNMLRCVILAATTLLLANQAWALPCDATDLFANCPPPPGAILDLDGTPIPHIYTQYSVNFSAVNTSTVITFAFRDDPAFLNFDDVSVTTGGGPNLLLNPGFELGLDSWTHLNPSGATFDGSVSTGGTFGTPHSGNFFFADGATQAYDMIAQAFPTTVGSLYTISFFLNETMPPNTPWTTFRRLSNTGSPGILGNGIDLLVYPVAVPEPVSVMLMALGGLALLVRGRSRRKD